MESRRSSAHPYYTFWQLYKWYLLIALCKWSNEYLPGFGFQKISENWFQPRLILGLFSIPLAVVVVLISRYFFIRQRRGSFLLGKLLLRPGLLALTVFLLCAVFEVGEQWAMQNWYYPTILHISYARGLLLHTLPFQLLNLAFWAALTFFAARKRLRASLA